MQQCHLTIKELEQRLISEERKYFLREEEVDNLIKKLASEEERKFSHYHREIEILTEKLSVKVKRK